MVVSNTSPMANNSVPNHDFAPAWLKLPSHDSTVKTSSSETDHFNGVGHNSRRDEIFGHDSKPEFVSSNNRRRSHIFPSRHHSIDVDDSKFYFHDGPHRSVHHVVKRDLINTKNNSRVNNSHYGSVPALQRRPHSRHDFRSNDVGNFHSAHNKGYSNNSDLSNGSVFHGSPRTRSQSRPQASDSGQKMKNSQNDVNNEPEDFNHQFPSLGNNSEDQNVETKQPCSINGGVWDNAHIFKVHHHTGKRMQLVQKPVKCENNEKQMSSSGSVTGTSLLNGSPKQNPHASIVNQANKVTSQNQASSSIYRAFVPSKSTLIRKTGKDAKSNSFNKDPTGNIKIISPPAIVQDSASKESGCASNNSPHMEILVKNPKHLSNKKSEFLKKLRNVEESNISSENHDGHVDKTDYEDIRHQQSIEEVHVNGIQMQKLHLMDSDSKDSILSSSLEAEQRLLREMGWKDEGSGDEDAYAPLTEDELREFHDLSRKIAEQRPSQQVSWSPKKIVPPFVTNAVVPPIEDDDDDSWSSSSSDSE